ncbi:MAG TPA: NAD-dependent epimerase/dehydratase family protein [Pyrinomonadaceae bacterium]|jgi:nucleoside-diphosphate-sugar epimerase|nr:NAD-dependent epimerase/dehydratase family protein [Pyrinomonadaceae bacterium]
MKAIVFGASGFVGREIAAQLRQHHFEVIEIYGPCSPIKAQQPDRYQTDITDEGQVMSLSDIGKADVVVCAAGIAHRPNSVPKDEFWRVNVKGVENVARLAGKLGACHFVLFSSVLVYGNNDGAQPVTENSECRPQDIYAKSKLAAEQIATKICLEFSINLTIFRPAPIIGAGSKGNFARLIKAIANGRFLWVGSGENLKSLVYVGDVARACVEVIERKEPGVEIFNLAAPPVKMKTVVNQIASILNRRVPKFQIPASVAIGPLRILASIIPGFSGSAKTLEKWLANEVYSAVAIGDAYGYDDWTDLPEAISIDVKNWTKGDTN